MFTRLKLQFSRSLAQVKLGEEIVIVNQRVPVTKLVPLQTVLARRASLGLDQGRFAVPDDFDAPLPDYLLTAFEGSEG